MADRAPFDIKWLIIGFGVQGGLSWLLPALLYQSLGPALVETMGPTAGILALVAIVAFGAFFCGGLLVAYFSPGDTVLEPAIAATLAIIVNQIVFISWGAEFSLLGTAIGVVLAYFFAWGGAKLGERLQGDTMDKMRERGELLKK